mmetsp:Transcript_51513/g.124389  ORF Transcript_51513/g.124389 Transcript_51513/m.124389 type:complete len:683 (+) Transcript_51513:67-2115(+)
MPIQRRKRQQHQRLDQIDRDSEYNEDDEDQHDGIDGIFRDAVVVVNSGEHLDSTTKSEGDNNRRNNNVDNNRNDRSSSNEKLSTGDSNINTINPIRNSNDHDAIQYLDIEDAIERLGMGRFQHGVFLACGLCFAADAMEVLLLSFLAVVLEEEWGLREGQTDSLISVVFLGAMLGTLVLSALGDIWGRKPVFAATAVLISFFGMATALCTTYTQLLVARFLVGFGVGGLTVPYDALGEMMGSSLRGRSMLSTSFFWTGGSLLVPLFAWMTLGGGGSYESTSTGSWRSFVVLCAVPCVFSAILGFWLVPESPRFLLSKGRGERALGILRKAAARNGKAPFITFPEGTVLVDEHAPTQSDTQQETHQEKNCCYLLSSPQRRKISFFLMWQWFGLAFVYYGCIIAVSIVFSDEESGDDSIGAGDVSTDVDSAAADTGTSSGSFEFDYSAILISSSAEVVGLSFAILVIDCWGRVRTQTWTYFLGGLCVLILGLLDYYVGGGVQVPESETSNSTKTTEDAGAIQENELNEDVIDQQEERRHLVFFAFLARMFIMAATSATWLHTSELLPTEIRATGHGLANASGRVGGLLCPFIITESSSLRLIGLFMFAVSVLASVCSYCLPETAGMALGDFVGSVENGKEHLEFAGDLELSECIQDKDQSYTTNLPLDLGSATSHPSSVSTEVT